MGFKKFIGNRAFYKMVFLVAIPIIVQNGITNFVSLLDNIMVGQVGTEQMSGVGIANQLIFVFNLCIFGGISGAGIFTAQFHGSGDHRGIRDTFRFKLIICGILLCLFVLVFIIFDDELISLYLHNEGSGDLALTLMHSRNYLRIMLLGLLPFAVSQAYSGTLRETGETVLPMIAGVAAVIVNLVFNWILIFGKLGAPALGVEGAAIATVLSRYVETVIVVAWTHRHKEKNPFISGAYRRFSIPKSLTKSILIKGTPLMANEMLWSVGMAVIAQCYSMRGLTAVAAVNIASTISNLFNVILLAMGNSIAIIVGNQLGAGKMKEARETDTKMIATSVGVCILIGGLVAAVAHLFPQLYNTTHDVKDLAAVFIRASACVMPVMAFNHGCYFTLRSGGKTFITFAFDSLFIWLICIPPAFLTARYTAMTVVSIYIMVQCFEIVKSVVGFVLVKKGIWLNNIVDGSKLPD
jgi:putative MATE family efflux protein